MKARIVKIGNSQGVRIPKLLIDQAALYDEVDIKLPPEGWDEAFKVEDHILRG